MVVAAEGGCCWKGRMLRVEATARAPVSAGADEQANSQPLPGPGTQGAPPPPQGRLTDHAFGTKLPAAGLFARSTKRPPCTRTLPGTRIVSNDPARFADAFRLEVTGGVTTLYVAGDLDVSTFDALSRALDRAVRMTVTELVVDLSACQFMCSRSLGLIEASAFELRERRARLVVRGQPAVGPRPTRAPAS